MVKFVHIEWDDSAYIAGWQDEQEISEWLNETEFIHTVGILLTTTKTHFVVAQHAGRHTGNVTKIPKGCVLKMKTIGRLKIDVDL